MPALESLGHLLTIREGEEPVPSRSDVLGDATIGGEEPRRMSWGLDALHAPLALAGGLLGVLRAVIDRCWRCSTPGRMSRFAAPELFSWSVMITRGT